MFPPTSRRIMHEFSYKMLLKLSCTIFLGFQSILSVHEVSFLRCAERKAIAAGPQYIK